MQVVGSRILVRTNMLLLILQLWQINSPSYLGNKYLHVGDDKSFFISHIGHTMLRSLKHIFTLSNVLHVPHITKPLLSVQNFCYDNNVYFEFHSLCVLCKWSHHQSSAPFRSEHWWSLCSFWVFCHYNSSSVLLSLCLCDYWSVASSIESSYFLYFQFVSFQK